MSAQPATFTGPIPLTGHSQDALAYVCSLLASGFTGTIELHCNQGGIRDVVEHKRLTGDQLRRLNDDGSNER